MRPVALVFLAIITLAALACTGGQPTSAPTSGSTTAPTVEATVMVATEARVTSEALAPTGKTAVDLPAKTPATSTTAPTSIPTPTPELTSTPTPASQLPATPTPTAMPSPAASPTATPTPTPATDPVLAGYAPLLEEARAVLRFQGKGSQQRRQKQGCDFPYYKERKTL